MSKNLKPLSKLVKTGSVWGQQKQILSQTSLLRLLSIGSLSFLLTLSSPFIPYSPSYVPSLQVLAQSNDARKAEADRLLGQGIEEAKTSQFEAALQSWQQALDIYREIKDREGEGHTLFNLGDAYSTLREYSKAISYLEQSLKIAREIKNRPAERAVLSNLGFAYGRLSDYPKAIEYFEQSLKTAQEINDRDGESTTLFNLGISYGALGDYPKAIKRYEQSLIIFQEIKDRQMQGSALGNLGVIYQTLGDYSKAIECHEQSLKIAQEINDRPREVFAMGNLGAAYNSMGNYFKAIEYQEQSLKIAREIKDRDGETAALNNLGISYRALGDYPKAIAYCEQALKIAREIKDSEREGEALGNLGIVYWSMGDYPKATRYIEQRLKIAQIMKDRQVEGLALGNLGVAYSTLGEYPKAIGYFEQSLKIAQEMKDSDGEGIALNNLGAAYYKIGNLQLAESTLLAGIKVRESIRGGLKDNNKISIFDTQSNTYRVLQRVLIAQNKTDEALEIAERGRARAFVELLASKLSSNPNEQLSTPPNIDQIKQIAKSQNATLVQYSIITDEFKVEGKSQTKESELYIWVVKPTGEIAFKQVDLTSISKSLDELVISARDSIGVRGSNMFNVIVVAPSKEDPTQKLQQLHKLLIAPIANLLPKNPNGRVIFIPQESLFSAPFPALLDEKGKYLIEKHTILTAPSIQVLDFTRQQKQRNSKLKVAGKNALVVGNPTMPKIELGDLKMDLPPLPGSGREAETVAELLHTKALIGDKANKATVIEKMQNASTIHLATHGLLQDFKGFGVPGAIVLAADSTPNDGINGLLTASEILDLKLRADLVVLSACDTGRGKITGDGVIGLSRSLISAGVPSVIVSLWKVNDNSTEFLMSEFYRNLQKNPDKAVALRQAMLTTMKQQRYSNPLKWAAFTLIGEAK